MPDSLLPVNIVQVISALVLRELEPSRQLLQQLADAAERSLPDSTPQLQVQLLSGLAVLGAQLPGSWGASVCKALQQQMGRCDGPTLARALHALTTAKLQVPDGFLHFYIDHALELSRDIGGEDGWKHICDRILHHIWYLAADKIDHCSSS